jgi:predicted transglutaminase-like cysteine proteinase
MRRIASFWAAGVAVAAALWAPDLEAAFHGLPGGLKFEFDQIRIGEPVLAPMAHVRFCLHYRDECQIHGVDFRRRNVALTPDRWSQLNTINRDVNRAITPEIIPSGAVNDEWFIAPPAGDCNDYAVTKRHELLLQGWPSRSLLLSEVVVPSGEHHLVLVVRTKNIDLVLDNLNANIRSVAMIYPRYRWVRIETPQNPRLWAAVRMPDDTRVAMSGEGD